MKEYLGIDLGGTNFKAGRVSYDKIDFEVSNPVHRSITEAEIFTILFKTVDAVITKKNNCNWSWSSWDCRSRFRNYL